MHFLNILNFLNAALKNDKCKSLDHSHTSPSIFQENITRFLLNLLDLTPNLVSGISVL